MTIFPTSDALTQGVAVEFVAAASRAINRSGRFVVALSGGATPRSIYRTLAMRSFAARVDWRLVHWCWCDERCVPPDDRASNFAMARDEMLDRLAIPAGNVHRIRGEDPPGQSAAAYERTLRELLGTPTGGPQSAPGRQLDLVLLGLGVDGHTASLFPGLRAVREVERWAVAECVNAVPSGRITLTPRVINAAAEVVFVVSGTEKSSMLKQVLSDPHDPDLLPSQIIAPTSGCLRWMVDTPAASQLNADCTSR